MTKIEILQQAIQAIKKARQDYPNCLCGHFDHCNGGCKPDVEWCM